MKGFILAVEKDSEFLIYQTTNLFSKKYLLTNLWFCPFCLIDIPYPPNMLQTISGPCSSINITWSPSTRSTLGGPVTSYLVQIKINGSQDPWHNCSSFDTLLSTSCLFTSLNKDTAYEVRVMAKNRLGYGLPSHTIIRTENTGN